MPAGERDYDGVEYADMVFGEVDWSEVEGGAHDPARRRERLGQPNEVNVHTTWATEACQDPRRIVRSAGSRSGMTVKVTGFSPSAGFVVTVIVAPKDFPPAERWHGATAYKSKTSEVTDYESEG